MWGGLFDALSCEFHLLSWHVHYRAGPTTTDSSSITRRAGCVRGSCEPRWSSYWWCWTNGFHLLLLLLLHRPHRVFRRRWCDNRKCPARRVRASTYFIVHNIEYSLPARLSYVSHTYIHTGTYIIPIPFARKTTQERARVAKPASCSPLVIFLGPKGDPDS